MPSKVTYVPRLTFSHLAWMKLQGFLSLSEREISGFGKVNRTSPWSFLVDDILVLPQKVSTAETAIEPESISEFVTTLIENGEDPGAFKLWWHSHAKGGLFWSTTDDNTMLTLTQDSNFMFGLVGNLAGEVKARLDLVDPVGLTVDDIPVDYQASSEEILHWCQGEMDRNVALLPVVVVKTRRGKARPRTQPRDGNLIEGASSDQKDEDLDSDGQPVLSFRRAVDLELEDHEEATRRAPRSWSRDDG